MSPDPALLPLAESVADGSDVDWDAVEASASQEEQPIVRQLRVLANLAVLHRTLAVSGESSAQRPARRSQTAPAIGTWGDLSLLERLGGGTFGEVYRAWDRHLERDVALKLLRADESADLDASRIAREGRLLARVRHANVITVHGVAVHDGRVGLWMELVRGATLEHVLLQQGPFGAREAALIGIDLCRALAAIHAAGLIHRDVKAQNVMREDGGRIVLMDLGTGREIDPASRGATDFAGTPLYLAPEIYRGSAASAKSDLYSLGVLLYHLVTASYPLRARTVEALQRGHDTGQAVRLRDARADLPAAFVRIVDRAIANDPDDRYASAGALEADLMRSLDAPADSRPAETPVARPRRVSYWRTGIWAASVVAVLTLGLLGVRALRRERPAPGVAAGPIRSIAVLPLVNLSGDASQEYVADGMTDELIATLGRTNGLNVISRTSVMQFKGSNKPVREIAETLHVDAVLEGSVMMLQGGGRQEPTGGKRVRINARLIHAGTDLQLWNKTFETVVADVLALQSEVAKAVTDGINSRLTSQQQPAAGVNPTTTQPARTVNPQAYDAYLRGRYLWNKRTPGDIRNAIEQFKAALDADPTYPVAWAGLADGYSALASYDEAPPKDGRLQAKAAAKKALALDESLAEAHTSLAQVEWTYDWNMRAAENGFKRAIVLSPNYSVAHAWYGLFLNQVSRFDEALAETQRAQELDPLSPVIQVNLGRCYYFARQYDKAIEVLRQLEQREPEFWIVHAILGQIYLAKGVLPEAIRELDRARQLSSSSVRNLGVLGDAYGRAGRRAEALALIRELSELSRRRYVSPIYPAMIQASLGDKRRALDLLDRAYADRSDWIMLLNVEPAFDALRAEPRFRELIRRAGQTPKAP